jgi:hypothetical protein
MKGVDRRSSDAFQSFSVGKVMVERTPQPTDGNERDVLLGWLAFHRDALAAKCAEVSADQLAALPVPSAGMLASPNP